MLQWTLAASLFLCVPVGMAAGQVPSVILGGGIGSQMLAGEVGVGLGPAALAYRTEGWGFVDHSAQSVLVRITPFHGGAQGPYAAAGWSRVSCAPASPSGASTGCRGKPVSAFALDAGVSVAASPLVNVFIEGGAWVSDSPEVPDWRFAAGVRLFFSPPRDGSE